MEPGKKIAAFILLLAFAGSSFYQAILVIDYKVNTAAFAKNCINKYRPQLHCNGQCQLMKKLQQQERKEQKNPELKLENKTEIVSARSFFPVLSFVSSEEQIQHFSFSDTRTIEQSRFIFHPPGLNRL